jgi:hypothetical protein
MNKENFPVEWVESLNAYLDGRLDADHNSQIEKMLAENAQARALLADLREVSNLLHTLPKTPAPANLSETVQYELERDVLLGHTDLHVNPAGRNHLRIRRLVAAAAMIVLLGAVGTIVYSVLFAPSHPRSAEPEKFLAKSQPAPVEPIIALEDAFPTEISRQNKKTITNIVEPDLELLPSEPTIAIPHLNTVHLAIYVPGDDGQAGQALDESLALANIDQIVRIQFDESRGQVAFVCKASQLMQLYHNLESTGSYPVNLVYTDPTLPEPMTLSNVTEADLREYTTLDTPAQQQAFVSRIRQANDLQNDWQDAHGWLANILVKGEPELNGLQPLGNPQFLDGAEPNIPNKAIMPGIPLAPLPLESEPDSNITNELPAGVEALEAEADQQLLAVIIEYPNNKITLDPNELEIHSESKVLP